MTWADLFIHEITTHLLNYKQNILDKFPALKNIRDQVEKNENVSRYLNNRLKTAF